MRASHTAFDNDVVLSELKESGRLNSLAISATASGGVAAFALVLGVVLMTAGA